MSEPPSPSRRTLDLALVVIAALGGAALAVMISGSQAGRPSSPPPGEGPIQSEVAPPEAALHLSRTFKEVAKRLRPAVLSITTERFINEHDNPLFIRDFMQILDPEGYEQKNGQARLERSFGTGFLVSPEGLAVTNNHVVADAKRVLVRLHDGAEMRAEVIGTDPLSDLAVLQLEQREAGYQSIQFGDSEGLDVGDWVLAIGNPFGLDQTVTAGIVSAKGRSRMGIAAYEDFIQTDASINPGNSGGPLVSMEGRVVGVATAIVSKGGRYQGIGFAIPANMAKDVMEDIVQHGRVVRGWLGVSVQDASPLLVQRLGLGEQAGALVSAVLAGSPAEKGGLWVGDLIVSFSGQPVEDATRLRNLAAKGVVGGKIAVGIVREGQPLTLEVVLAERPGQEKVEEAPPAPEETQRGVGISARELNARLAGFYGYEPDSEGVVITRVQQGSEAAKLGVRPGMILQEVERQPIRTLEDLNAAVEKLKPSEGVLLRVWDGAGSRFVLIEGRE